MWVWLGSLGLVLAFARLIFMVGRGGAPRASHRKPTSDGSWAHVALEKSRVGSVTVGIALDSRLVATFRREGGFDRWAKAWHIVREPQAGDPTFDDQVYVQSSDPALDAALPFAPILRDRLLELLRNPHTLEVSAGEGQLWVVSNGYGKFKRSERDQAEHSARADLLPTLIALRDALDKVRSVEGDEKGEHARRVIRGLAVALALLFVAAVAGWCYAWLNADHQVVQVNIPRVAWSTVVGAAAVFGFALWKFLGPTAVTHRVLMDIVYIAVPTAALAGYGGAMFANQAFDRGPAHRVHVPFAAAYEYHHGRSRGLRLDGARWPDARATPDVELSRAELALMSNQSCVDVYWRPGWLGDGWIERYARAEGADCKPGVPP